LALAKTEAVLETYSVTPADTWVWSHLWTQKASAICFNQEKQQKSSKGSCERSRGELNKSQYQRQWDLRALCIPKLIR